MYFHRCISIRNISDIFALSPELADSPSILSSVDLKKLETQF